MSSKFEKLEHEALGLSQQERAFLADRLLSSLDGDVLNDVDAAWIVEAEHRYNEYKKDKRQGVTAQDVFSEADQMLK